MDEPGERTVSLVPSPEEIVDMIQVVAHQSWPSTPDQYDAYFQRIGCELDPAQNTHDLEDPNDPDKDVDGVTRGVFTIPGAGTEAASWAARNGALFSLSFLAYRGRHATPLLVAAGYDSVRAGLIALYGPSPDEQEDQHGNRLAIWAANETSIELYAHLNEAPALQLGLSHQKRNTAYEQCVAHDAKKIQPHHR